MKLFKPDDFDVGYILTLNTIANRANEILQREVEKWPVVLQYKEGITSHWNTVDVLGRPDNPTHTARLAFIEEIKKEPCKHESEVYRNTWNDTGPRYIIDADNTKCKHCGVKLVAEWKEA